MKNLILVVIILSGLSLKSIYSQPKCEGKKEGKCCELTQMIPNLTDEQKKKIEQLQVSHLKEIQPLKDQMIEKRAHLRTLRNAGASEQDINKTIDEITSLENQIMKKCEAHYKAISSLLNDDQKVYFKQHCCKGGAGCCKHGIEKKCH